MKSQLLGASVYGHFVTKGGNYLRTNSGATGFTCWEKNNLLFEPSAINSDIKILASTTMNSGVGHEGCIQTNPDCLSFSNLPFFILLPSSRASFSVSFEFSSILSSFLSSAALYAYSAAASTPIASPAIVNNNATTVNGAFIANASVARATDKLFTNVNFSSENATQEVNSTFKWFKRTLYQPQNGSTVMPL